MVNKNFTGKAEKAGLLMVSTPPEILHMCGDGLRLPTPVFAKAAN